ncbi:ATP-binding cassette domain-containing protein [Roseobacter sp. YSTF-M11]|uniref:ATP-binding cassette domain-containing protein n=1 Tax=Roseobacter insulae TaxID=2859783 RepID=A0A9X1FSQ9_9RHOB|nr:ATP-binding cassette domain-containing protein [Roseobacter insulae]MBW4707076.1 ATP-binding cassette domain-containing protein [Roseobacter insulae]
MLRLEKITIAQGDFLLKADFRVTPGRKTAVIGPSGAGKSTLLGAIGGFLPLAGGKLWYRDAEITEAKPGQRPIAMLFQDNNLFPHLSIARNIGLGIRPDLKLSPEDHARVAKALERVGLHGMGDRKPGELSGGQQSRAALARVLVQDRPVILLDEPFAALGPALRHEMLDLVHDLSDEANATLLMVTHDPQDVRRIADDVIFVEGGRAAAPQPAAALLENPPPALQAYLG